MVMVMNVVDTKCNIVTLNRTDSWCNTLFRDSSADFAPLWLRFLNIIVLYQDRQNQVKN